MSCKDDEAARRLHCEIVKWQVAIAQLAPGTYTLTVSAAGHSLAAQTVTVGGEEDYCDRPALSPALGYPSAPAPSQNPVAIAEPAYGDPLK